MKLIKRLVCIFAFAFAAILLTGCSLTAEDMNEVAKKALEAIDDAKGYKIVYRMTGTEEVDGKTNSQKIYVNLAMNNDDELTYTLKKSEKTDGKKYSVKEKGTLKKNDDGFKFYLHRKTNDDGTKEEYKKYYNLTSSSILDHAEEGVVSAIMLSIMVSFELYTYQTLTQDDIDNGTSEYTYKISSFLGFNKVISDNKDNSSKDQKTTLSFNEKGTIIGKVDVKSNDGKGKMYFYMKCKDVTVKTPNGDYKEA